MAKRFTDTKKWEQNWFLELTPTQKNFWYYLCDFCDSVGIWEINYKLASIYIGAEVTESDLEKIGLGTRLIKISESKLWIAGFIKFQYQNFSENNHAHRGMMKSIIKSVGDLPLAGESFELLETFKRQLAAHQMRVNSGSTDSHGNGKGNGLGNGNGNGNGESEGAPDFKAEAEIYLQARRRFPGDKTAFEEFMGPNRMKILNHLGGLRFLATVKDDDFGAKRLADLIRDNVYILEGA